ncbi:hypothetical protein A6S26_07885 [Nostoc sp. ATCC 43529]|nr:hypothetical protein A6S26_07885 [Nostoc sp. ATCC 43529]
MVVHFEALSNFIDINGAFNPKYQNELRKQRKTEVYPSKFLLQDFGKSVVLLGIKGNIVVWLSAENDIKYILMHLLTLLLYMLGFEEYYYWDRFKRNT